MCNANNPAGDVLDSSAYTRTLSAAIVAGVLTGLKRLWLSSYLGTRTCGKSIIYEYTQYRKDVTTLPCFICLHLPIMFPIISRI